MDTVDTPHEMEVLMADVSTDSRHDGHLSYLWRIDSLGLKKKKITVKENEREKERERQRETDRQRRGKKFLCV